MTRIYHFNRLQIGEQLSLPFGEEKQYHRIRFAAYRHAERHGQRVRIEKVGSYVNVRRVA